MGASTEDPKPRSEPTNGHLLADLSARSNEPAMIYFISFNVIKHSCFPTRKVYQSNDDLCLLPISAAFILPKAIPSDRESTEQTSS